MFVFMQPTLTCCCFSLFSYRSNNNNISLLLLFVLLFFVLFFNIKIILIIITKTMLSKTLQTSKSKPLEVPLFEESYSGHSFVGVPVWSLLFCCLLDINQIDFVKHFRVSYRHVFVPKPVKTNQFTCMCCFAAVA